MSEGHAKPGESDHHEETPPPFVLWMIGGVAKGVAGAPLGISLELGEKHANDNHDVGGHAGGGVNHESDHHVETGGHHDESHGATGHAAPGHSAPGHAPKGHGAPDTHHNSEGGAEKPHDPHDPHAPDAANDNGEAPHDDHDAHPVAAHKTAA